MNLKRVNEKISGVLCNSALNFAKKTVEQNGPIIPLCTIIIHQPEVPAKLKRLQNNKEVN